MHRSLTALILVLTLVGLAGAQTLVDEDFQTASGFTAPTGWSISLTAGTAGIDGWRFDDPNANGSTLPIAPPFATCDSDFSGIVQVDARLASPAFNASSASVITLDWHQWHQPLSSTIYVDVFDGAIWNTVYSDTNGTPNADFQSIDITAATGASPLAQVRFRYVGNFDWHWQVDNVKIWSPVSVDLELTSIDAPAGSSNDCTPLGTGETITVTVTSFGSAVIPAGTPIPMSYSVDFGTPVNETLNLPSALAFGQSTQLSFATTADFSTVATHTVDAVVIFGDQNPINDAIIGHQISSGAGQLGVSAFPWSEDFESTTANLSTTPPPGWLQAAADATGVDSDWYFSNTPTSSTGTGPSNDHTTGSGYYAYVEDSGGNHPTVNLATPCLDMSGLSNPRLNFWVHSNNSSTPTTTNQNFLAVDALLYPGGIPTLDLVTPIGHVGSTWTQMTVDLSAYAGQTVRLRFRGRSDGGSFTHDIAIDDVRVFEYIPGNGQAPQVGLAEIDVNGAIDGTGFPVSAGNNGPFYATAAVGGSLTMSFSGQANQPVVMLFGPLNEANATYPGVGRIDIGGPLGPGGFPTQINLFGDGTNPNGWNIFFNTGPSGTGTLVLPVPLLPSGVLTTFQAALFTSNPIPVSLSNAVELSIM